MMHVVLFLQDVGVVGAGHGHRKDAPPSGNQVVTSPPEQNYIQACVYTRMCYE